MQNILSEFQNFMRNPAGYLAQQGANIPGQYMSNPHDAIQYLMNTGKLSQADYNQLQQRAKQIQDNPAFKQLFNQ